MPARLGTLWLGVAALAVGAWLGSARTVADWKLGVAAVLGAGTVALSRRSPMGVLLAVIATAFALGFVGASARASEGTDLERAAERTHGCAFEGRVVEQAGGLGTLVSLEAATCTAGSLPRGNVFWDATAPPPVGTPVQGWGWVTALGDDEFALARRRAGGRALLHPLSISIGTPRGFWGGIAGVRARLGTAAISRLPDREAALLLGLTVGDTSRIPASDLEAFRASGLAHVLAVSGSNVAIVLGAVAGLTRRLGYARRLTITLASAVAFVAIVGPDGSVLRASVMGTLALLAGGWIRPIDPVHSLPFALLVLVAARPPIVTSAGLHLSAAATLGIILWSKRATDRLDFLPAPIAGSLGVTVAAQVGVAPLLVLLFERLSVVAPASNVLAAPAIAFATLAGMGAAVTAPLFPSIASLVAGLASPALRWIITVAEVSASSSWAEIEVPPSWGWLLGALVLGAALRSLRRGAPA